MSLARFDAHTQRHATVAQSLGIAVLLSSFVCSDAGTCAGASLSLRQYCQQTGPLSMYFLQYGSRDTAYYNILPHVVRCWDVHSGIVSWVDGLDMTSQVLSPTPWGIVQMFQGDQEQDVLNAINHLFAGTVNQLQPYLLQGSGLAHFRLAGNNLSSSLPHQMQSLAHTQVPQQQQPVIASRAQHASQPVRKSKRVNRYADQSHLRHSSSGRGSVRTNYCWSVHQKTEQSEAAAEDEPEAWRIIAGEFIVPGALKNSPQEPAPHMHEEWERRRFGDLCMFDCAFLLVGL